MRNARQCATRLSPEWCVRAPRGKGHGVAWPDLREQDRAAEAGMAGARQKRMTRTTKGIPALVVAAASLLFVSVVACDEEEEHGKPVSDSEAALREEAGLHPVERRDKQAETPEELKKDLDLEPDPEPDPETEQELRKEMDLHPDEKGKLE